MKERADVNDKKYVVYRNDSIDENTSIVLKGVKNKTVWNEGFIFAPYIPESILHFPDIKLIENKKGS